MSSLKRPSAASTRPAPAGPASAAAPLTGLNREQAIAWLLTHCRKASEPDADQALDDAVTEAATTLAGHTITWRHGAGFTIDPARPGRLIRPLAYWIFMATALTVYALQGLAGNHTVIPALALAVALFALTRAAQKLTLLARQRHGHSGTAPPAPRRSPRAILADWFALEATAYRELRAALNQRRNPTEPATAEPGPPATSHPPAGPQAFPQLPRQDPDDV